MDVAPLDIRDISIIDALPHIWKEKTILTVGCGNGRIEQHIENLFPEIIIIPTDVNKFDGCPFDIKIMDIYNPDFDFISDVVICSQVLEHLVDWKKALHNLIALAELRVIITVPYKNSFDSLYHVNHWDDLSINKFKEEASTYSTYISKIRTKPEDVIKQQWGYLIIIDKKQKYG